MREVVITSAVRTPIGSFCGAMRDEPIENLGAIVLNEAIKRSGVKPEEVDDVVLSSSYANGESPNLARLALLKAGWPVEVPGITVDRRCCSGVQSVWNGFMEIFSEYADTIVTAGADSMSRAEFYIPGNYLRWGVGGITDPKWGTFPRQHGAAALWGLPFYDRIQRVRPMHQPVERFGELHSMMTWAETAAKKEKISREEADKWALGSHQKAVAAMDAGKFKEEIIGVPVSSKDHKSGLFEVDETPRRDTTLEKLAKLKTVYEGGVCTAGNSSSENDGAGAVVLMTAEKAKQKNLKPLAYIKAFGIGGADPTLTYPAVPIATSKALKKAGLSINQMDLIEIQEAFAVQTIADARLIGLSDADMASRVNVNGSGISLGHPIGATGVLRLVTLLHEMNRRNSKYGLLTICGGGGLGICMIVGRDPQ
jgi:acetyl-CoA C-acetyltransferase